MKYQSPDSNNPANPLNKVASLTVDKEQSIQNNKSCVKIKVNLNFKFSSDLKGLAMTTDGEKISVCFSLGIEKATFSIDFHAENHTTSERLVDITQIYHQKPLGVSEKIDESEKTANKSSGSRDFKIGTGFDVTTEKQDFKLSANASASHGKERQTTYDINQSKSYENMNISVTNGGNNVHWEFIPKSNLISSIPRALRGEVFQINDDGNLVDACIVYLRNNLKISQLSVTGSVYTRMQDLLLDEIKFVDYLGEEVDVLRVQDTSPSRIRMKIFKTDLDKRLTKQIIRKHLVSQGMKVEGTSIEICRAEV
ncbi:hypothetical protein [Methylobacterium sp. Gmos1]